MPLFWLGIMLIIIFAVRLKVLPASGYGTWQHFLMPAFCLGAFLAPITMRLVRSGVIEVMNMEFIKTARAKGVAERMVVVKHAFRNACIPVITVLGLQFGQLLGGAIVTETVFAWPGRGHAHRGLDPQPGLPGGAVRGRPARAASSWPSTSSSTWSSASSTRASGWAHEGGERGAATSRSTSADAPVRARTRAGARCAGSGGSSGAWPPRVILLLIVAVTVARAVDRAPRSRWRWTSGTGSAPPAWMEGGTTEHLLGTDQVGRDLLSRMIYGGRVSLLIGVAAVRSCRPPSACCSGSAAGYFGGEDRLDRS